MHASNQCFRRLQRSTYAFICACSRLLVQMLEHKRRFDAICADMTGLLVHLRSSPQKRQSRVPENSITDSPTQLAGLQKAAEISHSLHRHIEQNKSARSENLTGRRCPTVPHMAVSRDACGPIWACLDYCSNKDAASMRAGQVLSSRDTGMLKAFYANMPYACEQFPCIFIFGDAAVSCIAEYILHLLPSLRA